MKRFFVSDMHFGDDRFNVFYRPFKTLDEQHKTIIDNWNAAINPEDEVYVVGDVAVTDDALKYVDQLNGKKILILGNYDEPRPLELLQQKFEKVCTSMTIEIDGETVNLTHYPAEAYSNHFNIVGHIHGLWKVQRNMINVGVDAWNYLPVSEDQIKFCMNAIRKFYDVNVFAGELYANIPFTIVHSDEKIKISGPSIFLAGPTPRNTNASSWRPDFIKALQKTGFKGTVLIPETKIYNPNHDYDTQIEWEDEGLTKADMIAFWVPRELKEMPAFTTNVEFGEFLKSGKSILGYPKEAEKMRYLHAKAIKYNIPIFHDMNQMCAYIVSNSKKKTEG